MDELSRLYDKKTLDKIYRIATDDRHGFLYGKRVDTRAN